MVKKYFFLSLISLFLTVPKVTAKKAVTSQLSIYQFDTNLNKERLIFIDTADFVKNVNTSGFVGPFSLQVELLDLDTVNIKFSVQIITLAIPAKTYSRIFTDEYSLPAKINNIEGKNKSRYSFVITPLKAIDIDSTVCPFNDKSKGSFTFTPSAHADIYFVPSSLGDFYWDSVKELLESNFSRFQLFTNFSLPGKTLVYLCPCPLTSIIWDKRFGTSVDPTRNICYSIYNKDMNTTDPFIITHNMVLRNYGYAPLFLSEGLANYFSFAIYDMKEILKEKKSLPLAQFLDSYKYQQADPILADRTSATFAKYLIDRYNLTRFIDFYKSADDINLKNQLQKTYGKTVSELETDWQKYVDTVQIPPEKYAYFAAQAELMLNYQLMLKYTQSFLRVAQSVSDSSMALPMLTRAYFFNGNYYQATNIQKIIIDKDDKNASKWMELGSYEMMDGYYRKAYNDYLKAHALDSANQIINFNIALNCLYRGKKDSAKTILLNNLDYNKGAQAQGETRIYLANLLKDSQDKAQQKKATQYYQEAISMFKQALQANNASASAYMWIGIAYLGLDDVDNATNYLHTAEFIETRPFYLGMINLWLGKTYEKAGDKKKAKEFFGKVLSLPSADYNQREAKLYLKNQNTKK